MQNNIKRLSMFKWVFLIVIGLTISACGKKEFEKTSQVDQAATIKRCLERLYQGGSKQKYLVSPIYDDFDFNSFFKKNKILEDYRKGYDHNQKKEQIFHLLNWTGEDFKENQQTINKYYLNKSNPLLLKLSNSKVSETVFYFSGIHENLVFANVIDYCDSIKYSELNSSLFDKNQQFRSALSVIFILKDSNVQDMIIDSGIAISYECP